MTSRLMAVTLRAAARASCLALVIGALITPGPSFAQDAGDYPSKPIRLVVPTARGGGNDTTARAIADAVSKTIGQPLVVDASPEAFAEVVTKESKTWGAVIQETGIKLE